MFCSKCGSGLKPRDDKRLACSREGCKYVHYENPVPVVAGIVQIDDSVVLVQNKGTIKSHDNNFKCTNSMVL